MGVSTLLVVAALAATAPAGSGAIDWRSPTPETFHAAESAGKPVFVVVHASWCFWCESYMRRSLNHPQVVSVIRRHYVPVLVDYDRRQDLVERYEVQGLPFTVVLDAHGRVRARRPGMVEPERLVQALKETVRLLATEKEAGGPESAARRAGAEERVPRERLKAFTDMLLANADRAYGGLRQGSGKHPYPDTLLYLLATAGERGGEWVRHALDGIAGRLGRRGRRPGEGEAPEPLSLPGEPYSRRWRQAVLDFQGRDPLRGLYDPPAGGFFRYAQRRDWTLPHFEKVTRTEAPLLAAYALSGRAEDKAVARRSLDHLLDTLYDPGEGRFFVGQAADELYYHLPPGMRADRRPPPVDRTTTAEVQARGIRAALLAADRLDHPGAARAARAALSTLRERLLTDRGLAAYLDERGRPAGPWDRPRDLAWALRALAAAGDRTTARRVAGRLEAAGAEGTQDLAALALVEAARRFDDPAWAARGRALLDRLSRPPSPRRPWGPWALAVVENLSADR